MPHEAWTEDVFKREQIILEHAQQCSDNIHTGLAFDVEEYHILVKEYRRLLKQIRRMTKIYDRNTESLNTSKLNLLDKVQYDALTGIYNRRYLEENLKKVLFSLSESNDILSVMMLDVDFFKRYNDTYGHSAGDECLRKTAKTIAASLTCKSDFAARYGGEEFFIVLPGMDESGARIIANRILESIRALNIPHEKNEAANYITISIGVTTATTDKSQTWEDYIKRADEALYLSKNRGRNRYTFIEFGGEKENGI